MRTNSGAEDPHALLPDPFEPCAEQVERYVGALQGLAKSDPHLARRQVWSQILLAAARASRRRDEVHDSLNRVFRLGVPPEPPVDGFYDGVLVTTTTFAATDPFFRAISCVWMPWVGKRFDARLGIGDNTMLPSARLPARLLWPGYRFHSLDDGRYAAFSFRTYEGAGVLDPERRMLKIDYDWDENPRFLIRDILDELVQIVPGVYLGKALFKRGKPAHPNSWRLVGYFALRPAALGASETVPSP